MYIKQEIWPQSTPFINNYGNSVAIMEEAVLRTHYTRKQTDTKIIYISMLCQY